LPRKVIFIEFLSARLAPMSPADQTFVTLMAGVVALFSFMIGGFLWLGRKDKTYFVKHPLTKFWSAPPFSRISRSEFQLVKVHDLRNGLVLQIQFSDENEKQVALLEGGMLESHSTIQLEDKVFKIHFPQNKSLSPTTTIFDPETGSPLWELVRTGLSQTVATLRESVQWKLDHLDPKESSLGISQNRVWKNEKNEIVAIKHAPFKYRRSNTHVIAIRKELSLHEKALIFATFNS
jgi:hypothetical protein